jgi:hypothetical protein
MLRSRVLLAAGLFSLPLAVSAEAQNGDPDREKMRLLAAPARVLLPEELRGNCAGLTVTIKTRIDRLRELQKKAKKEEEGPPLTFFGERPGVTEAAEERTRVEALNVVLEAKGCNLVNIEEELQKVPPPPPATKADHRPAAIGHKAFDR